MEEDKNAKDKRALHHALYRSPLVRKGRAYTADSRCMPWPLPSKGRRVLAGDSRCLPHPLAPPLIGAGNAGRGKKKICPDFLLNSLAKSRL